MAGGVSSGDKDMMDGSIDEGSNSEKTVIVKRVDILTKNRDYTIERDLSLAYCAIVDGKCDVNNEKAINIEENMTVKRYDGKKLFRKPKKVCFVAVNTNPTPIAIPFSMRMSSAEYINGVLSLRIKCIPQMVNRMLHLLGTEYAKTEVHGFERHTFLTANDISIYLKNDLAAAIRSTVAKFDTSFNVVDDIHSRLSDALRRCQPLHDNGIAVSYADATFSETEAEKVRRILSENNAEMAIDKSNSEKNQLKIKLAIAEYDLANGE